MGNLVYRRGTIEDTEEIAKLLLKHRNAKLKTELLQEQIEMMSESDSYYLLVVTDGDRIVGTASGMICVDIWNAGRSYAFIENVVLLPEYRGQDIGKKMVGILEEWAKEKGCLYITLLSGFERISAYNFYEYLGYSSETGYKKYLTESENK